MSTTGLVMADVVCAVHDGLATDLAAVCEVEEFWRLEPPTVLTTYVQPNSEPNEKASGIGNVWASGMNVDVICEQPWDDTVAAGAALSACVELVKHWVDDNRDLQVGYVYRYGTITYQFATRPGSGKPTLVAVIPVNVEWPV
jgi:hypothetical protein